MRPRKGKPPGHARPARPATQWGPVAEWYDRLVGEAGSEYHQRVIIPGVIRLLGLRPGLRVLDVACGQGVLCRALAAAGAAVTGVDASAELLRLARQRGGGAIQYLRADARDLSALPAALALRGLPLRGAFDAAACVLALQNIHPLPPVFQGLARCLADGGRLVAVVMHPCFRGPKATCWGWDQAAGVQYRRVDRYLVPRKEPIVTHPGSDATAYTWTFHRPLEAYVKALRSAGLLIDAMEEWPGHKASQPGPRAAAENLARKEIPLFLALRAVKRPVSDGYQTSAVTVSPSGGRRSG